MASTFRTSSFLFMFAVLIAPVQAQETWTPAQEEIINTVDRLSASTALDGEGADAYGELLADSYTRWTVGSNLINDKLSWIEGIRDWFDDGWRVSKRESQYLEILVQGEYAFTRRIVNETYLGPNGDTSESMAALAETWIKNNDEWLLWSVNIHPMPQ